LIEIVLMLYITWWIALFCQGNMHQDWLNLCRDQPLKPVCTA